MVIPFNNGCSPSAAELSIAAIALPAGSFDLAAVFGDGFDTFPAATGGNFLVEILPMLF